MYEKFRDTEKKHLESPLWNRRKHSLCFISIQMMLAAESLINELVDWFGEDFRIYEKYPDNQVMVSLKCNEHAFFYWALQYGPYVEVMEPASLRNRIADAISEMNEKYHRIEDVNE